MRRVRARFLRAGDPPVRVRARQDAGNVSLPIAGLEVSAVVAGERVAQCTLRVEGSRGLHHMRAGAREALLQDRAARAQVATRLEDRDEAFADAREITHVHLAQA